MIGNRTRSRKVDDLTGPVTKRNFKLSASDWIEVQVESYAN